MKSQTRMIILGTVLLIVISAMAYFVAGKKPQIKPKGDESSANTSKSTQLASSDSKYVNTDYGFEFDLPAGWKGYSVVLERWEGNAESDKGQVKFAEGTEILIRHPFWRSQEPRQDIPIMIFMIGQWDDMQQGRFHVGAAPINPSELGRNSRYVFALPARYNYAFLPGWEDVEKILEGKPLRAF